ncbi:MAG: hypothetical protein KJ964_00055 [Verrucomicrobia bacterium]|nr:hypothetical protein [Verrucomicrobiota bacterium]MBU1733719.1 hypothetical protein [Verrucomicrobiota bacterium]MBU1855899.1 hypothetical protein [Verrucomicrobiota bacterium]
MGLRTTAAVAATPESRPAPRVEKMTSGAVELIITADPAQVHLDRDILLSIKTIAPSNITVRLPPLDNRLTGFTLSGAFDREPTAQAGTIAHEHCFRLTPLVAAEYRLAPMAVTYTDASRPTAPESWFATRAIVFGVAPIGNEHPGASRRDAASIRDIRGPVWIYPAFKTVAGWMAILALMGVGAWALYRLSRRVHRAIQLRRMSPRERALNQLVELLKQDLVGKGKIKEFYIGLTMIVRCYIEGAHSIRAPEQTTEEFLVTAANNSSFKPEVVKKLKVFLQTSDLVKFAVYHPGKEIIDQTLATAGDYIDTDEEFQQKEKEA